ncbi:ATP-binding protein [Methylosinus sp. LW4]|uniref:ATP-binding protein n=1 Tax=Methylosinus sp. LW4 TaxID=136993 RepID=UPI0012FA0A89
MATDVHVAAERERVSPIRIEDDGSGVPPEKLIELGRRGVRLRQKTESAGLGLSIRRRLWRAIRFGTRSPHGFQADHHSAGMIALRSICSFSARRPRRRTRSGVRRAASCNYCNSFRSPSTTRLWDPPAGRSGAYFGLRRNPAAFLGFGAILHIRAGDVARAIPPASRRDGRKLHHRHARNPRGGDAYSLFGGLHRPLGRAPESGPSLRSTRRQSLDSIS